MIRSNRTGSQQYRSDIKKIKTMTCMSLLLLTTISMIYSIINYNTKAKVLMYTNVYIYVTNMYIYKQ